MLDVAAVRALPPARDVAHEDAVLGASGLRTPVEIVVHRDRLNHTRLADQSEVPRGGTHRVEHAPHLYANQSELVENDCLQVESDGRSKFSLSGIAPMPVMSEHGTATRKRNWVRLS